MCCHLFVDIFSKLCSGCCPKDKQSCGDATTATVLARATYTEGVKNVPAGCNSMDFCRGSQNRCRPRRRIILLLDRSPLELRFQSTEWVAATTSDFRTLAADTEPSATSSLASLSSPPPATSLYLATPTVPAVHTSPTNFLHEQCNFRQRIVVLTG